MKTHSSSSFPTARAPAGASARPNLTRDDLDRLLAQLRDEYQQVIRLRNQDRLPWDVIGQRLGRTATEARYLWIDALSDLHRLLGPPS